MSGVIRSSLVAEPTPAAQPAPAPRAAVRVRPARASDVTTLVRYYLGQDAQGRRFYHPFPFRPGTLRAMFTYMVLERRLSHFLVRVAPGAAIILLVAERVGTTKPIGFCTIRFPREASGEVKALFGSFVASEARGNGVGDALLHSAIEVARVHGIRFFTTTFLSSNTVSATWIRKRGLAITETGRDLRCPDEPNYVGEIDLEDPARKGATESGSKTHPA